jgi:pimeloyl-ACP methyl ester carboxylesterase
MNFHQFTHTITSGTKLEGIKCTAGSGVHDCLFIQGLGCDVNALKPTIEGLQGVFKNFLAVDLVGTGLSQGTALGSSPWETASYLKKLCIDHGFNRPYVITLSFGGYIGLELLGLRSDEFQPLSLFAIVPPFEGHEESWTQKIRNILSVWRFGWNMALGAGLPMKRTMHRIRYEKYTDMNDLAKIRYHDAARCLGSPGFLWMFVALGLKRADHPKRWAEFKAKYSVEVFEATDDELVNSTSLAQVISTAGWGLHRFKSKHCSFVSETQSLQNLMSVLIPSIRNQMDLNSKTAWKRGIQKKKR